MNRHFTTRMAHLALPFLAATLVLASPSARAEASDEDASPAMEEVIVTATYRETRLMDTPQAISAVTDDLVEDLGAQSMEDVYTMVPGLSMSGGLDGENRYTIRGVSSQTGGVGYFLTGATIGVYLDGTPVTAALGPDNQVSGTMFDIERVEVLKGPQGTLFGEGSQGGTIRYLYKQPDPTAFDVAVNASYSNMGASDDYSRRLDGMVNIPLREGLALRVTGWDAETAGFVDNIGPLGDVLSADYNPASRTGYRAALRYEGENYAIGATIYNSDQETDGAVTTLRAYENSAPSIPGQGPWSTDKIDIYSFVLEVDFPWASFESLTSFTDRRIHSNSEASYQFVWLLDFVYGGSALATDHPGCTPELSLGWCPRPGWNGFLNLGNPGLFTPDGMNLRAMVGFGRSYSERWVQEFRLVSPGDKRVRWTAGLFWKDSEDHSQNQQLGNYFPGREEFGVRFDTLLMVPANTHTDLLEEYAAFGELSFDLTDNIEVTLGLRYSSMEQYFSNTDSGTDDSPVSPKFVVSWRPMEDWLVYFNYATGFRPGNVNNHMEFNVRQYDILIQDALAAGGQSERVEIIRNAQQLALARRFFDGDDVESYELGVKATLWDSRVQLTASAYYLDWHDMILVEDEPALRTLSAGTNTYNTNSGGAEIQGFELEVSARLTERFTVRLTGDTTDTEVSQGPLYSDQSPEGNELIYAPGWTASLAADYTIPMNNGWRVVLHADQAWVAEQFVNTQNTLSIPSYERTNARVTFMSDDDKWRIAAYGQNLANDETLRGRSSAIEQFYWFPPRQIGIEVGYQL